jgi:hypothetical protein
MGIPPVNVTSKLERPELLRHRGRNQIIEELQEFLKLMELMNIATTTVRAFPGYVFVNSTSV